MFYPVYREAGSIAISVLVGLALGALIFVARDLPKTWKALLLLSVPALTVVMLLNSPRKTLLVLMLIAVPLSLDISLIVVVPPYEAVALSELRVSIATLALILGYASWLLTKPRGQERQQIRFFAGTSIPALGLILASVVSAFGSVDIRLSIFQIVQLCELFLTYIFVANYIKSRDDVRFILLVMTSILLMESAFILFQQLTGFTFNLASITGSIYWGRIAGTLEHPNNAGAFLAVHLPIVFGALLLARNTVEKWWAAIAFGMGAMALIAPQSRGAWSGFLVAMVLFVLLGFRRGWVPLRTILLVILCFAVVAATSYETIVTRLTGDDGGSADSRSTLARLAWNMIKAKPMFGVGANTFSLNSKYYATPDLGRLGWLARAPAHNKHLLVWAETGTFGMFFWVWLLLAALVRGLRSANSNDKLKGLAATGFICALIVFISHMMADHLLSRAITLLLWLLIAILTGIDGLPSLDTKKSAVSINSD